MTFISDLHLFGGLIVPTKTVTSVVIFSHFRAEAIPEHHRHSPEKEQSIPRRSDERQFRFGHWKVFEPQNISRSDRKKNYHSNFLRFQRKTTNVLASCVPDAGRDYGPSRQPPCRQHYCGITQPFWCNSGSNILNMEGYCIIIFGGRKSGSSSVAISIFESIRHRAVQSNLKWCDEDRVPSLDLDSYWTYCPSKTVNQQLKQAWKKFLFLNK